ncbi:MAG: glycosyltransferase, partial [Patescibacteria group bacterium]
FSDAPLFTSVYKRESAFWADEFEIKTSFLQNLPFASGNHELLATLMPIAFESFDFSQFDLVISITSEAAKGIITKPGTCHICYCLTPTRYLWSGYETYFSNPLLRFVSSPIVSYLRKWDLVASQRPDYYFSISEEVAKRIDKYYKRKSEVVYPALSLTASKKQSSKEDFYLLVGRFVPYKRIDLAIEAFNKTGKKLKIVGSGRSGNYLKSKARPNIEFFEDIDDQSLSDLYLRARALVFPGVEDFGLSMVEAQSFGTPVIAFRGGGALEIINEDTGEFFDEQNIDSLILSLKRFDNKRYNLNTILENAERFSFENFKVKFVSALEEKLRDYKESL